MGATEHGSGAILEQIEEIYRTRQRELVRLAQAIVGDPDSARDVVHDAFVSVVKNRSAFAARGSLDGWVWRTVVNKARDHRRRTPPRPEAVSDLAAFEDRSTREAVRAAVATLPTRQRYVVFLHYFGDLDYRTIGEVLEMQPGTVAATLNAARAALRSQLDPDERAVD